MKRFLSITLLFLCCFLLPAGADIAYEPPQTVFYKNHRKDCSTLERWYYANGENGYISLLDAPKTGGITAYYENGEQLFIACTYTYEGTEWGYVTERKGAAVETPGWAPMASFRLVYDYIAFQEEFGAAFTPYTGDLQLPEGETTAYYWSYPGSDQKGTFVPGEGLTFTSSYLDPQGLTWAFIPYYRGLRNVWVCIDKPCDAAPAQNTGVSSEPDIIPPSIPPTSTASGIPWLAVFLVAGVVLGSAVLLFLCFWQKKP